MQYQVFSLFSFDLHFKTEQSVVDFLWEWKLQNQFSCSCGHKKFYQLKSRQEVRECARCGKQHRLRAGTIFENSKVSLRHWLYTLMLMMSGKRGVSALEVQRHTGINSYKTVWGMLHKIRTALIARDGKYRLEGLLELDSAQFGKRVNDNQQEVLIGIESRQWMDEKGRKKEKAGFAQVMIANETKVNAKKFINQKIKTGAMIHTDGASSYDFKSEQVSIESITTAGNKKLLQEWQPWVFRFINNAKAWIVGTHHGIRKKYLANYLGEYTYRFNRRHDPKRLFTRALKACMEAKPIKLVEIYQPFPALTG